MNEDGYAVLLLLLLHLKVGTQGLTALIDSGAMHGSIGESDKTRVSARSQLPNAAPLSVQLANGRFATTLGAYCLQVQFGSISKQLVFHVLDMSIDAVLGIPWL